MADNTVRTDTIEKAKDEEDETQKLKTVYLLGRMIAKTYVPGMTAVGLFVGAVAGGLGGALGGLIGGGAGLAVGLVAGGVIGAAGGLGTVTLTAGWARVMLGDGLISSPSGTDGPPKPD